jgi:hypothetical protein
VSCLCKNTFYSQYCIGVSNVLAQNHKNIAGTTNLQKKKKKIQKKVCLKFFKTEKNKKIYGSYTTDFFPGPTKIQKILLLEKELKRTKVMRMKNKNKFDAIISIKNSISGCPPNNVLKIFQNIPKKKELNQN